MRNKVLMGGAFKNEQFVHHKAFALNERPINKDILKLCILWAETIKNMGKSY